MSKSEESFEPGGWHLFLIGFMSLLGQVAVLRELNVVFYGVELIYVLSVGVWMFWTAIGAAVGKRGYAPPLRTVLCLFVLFGVLLPAEIAFARGARLLFGGIVGSYLPFGSQFAAMLIVLVPMGIILGLLFQWVAKRHIENGKTLAHAYAVESVGGIAGGLASTLLMMFGVSNFAIAVFCSLSATGIAMLSRQTGKAVRFAGGMTFVVLVLVLLYSEKIDHRMTGWNHPHLIDTRDSPYGRVTVSGQLGQYNVFENDALSFESESTSAEEFVHLAAIQRERVGNVLILEGGITGIRAEVLKHRPEKTVCVDLNATLMELVETELSGAYQASLEAENVRTHIADSRNFMRNAGKYDLILSGVSEPSSGGSNRFFTREFFEACASKLKKGGVFAFRLRSSENVWTRFLAYRNTSIHRALASVFRHTVFLPGTIHTVIASDTELVRDPEILGRRFLKRNVTARLVSPPYINFIYTNDRFSQIAETLNTTHAFENTDVRPVCYQYSGMIWLSKFFPSLINLNLELPAFSDSKKILFFFAMATLVVISFVGVRYFQTKSFEAKSLKVQRIVLVCVAGFVGMVLETMLILYYQAKSGALFQNIGILFMVFMAGLAAGSWAVMRRLGQSGKRENQGRRTGKLLVAGFGILSLLFVGVVKSGYPSGIFSVSLFLFATGFCVSGTFAFAGTWGVNDGKTAVSPLYASDLIGGCVGSVFASLILIPFLGMAESALMIAGLAFASLILVK